SFWHLQCAKCHSQFTFRHLAVSFWHPVISFWHLQCAKCHSQFTFRHPALSFWHPVISFWQKEYSDPTQNILTPI
ncbi:MAG: hypothetical protein QM541_02455, partial [Flavobacterium sp.]|nr:hypothetical protein [Flavobacterium sp.]